MQFNCLLKFLNDRKVKLALETGNPETGNEVEEKIGDIRLQLQLIYDIVFEGDFTFLPFKIYRFTFLGFNFCGLVQQPYLITKLDSAERTWKELSV